MIKRHVLVVEDDPATIQVIKFILSHAGYVVKTASNGYDALDMIEGYKFDLILLDLNMPMVNGFSFLESFHRSEKAKDIPVFVVTSRDDKNSIIKAKDLGATHYIIKPLDKADILQKIETTLGTRPQGYEAEIEASDKNSKVDFSFEGRVLSMSETGCVFLSPAPFPIDHMLTSFDNPIFNKLGVTSPRLQVCECKPAGHVFEIYVSFLSLSRRDAQALREWVLGQSLKQRNLRTV